MTKWLNSHFNYIVVMYLCPQNLYLFASIYSEQLLKVINWKRINTQYTYFSAQIEAKYNLKLSFVL